MVAKMETPRILIIDDDAQLCRLLERTFAAWNMVATSLNDPLQVPAVLLQHPYPLVLLDMVMPQRSGLEVLADIQAQHPTSKVIILTAYADKDIAIQALRQGAFDLLEKPLTMALLSHAVQRALDSLRVEQAHRDTLHELQRSQEMLLARTAQLEQVNRELLDTNKALEVLARQIGRAKYDTETRLIRQIRSLLVPLVAQLQQETQGSRSAPKLDLLASHVDDVISGLATSLQETTALSAMELRIALMIKNGFTGDEIARQLYISPETVKSHRRNIRKKLGLGTQDTLSVYLQTFDNHEALHS